MTSREALTELFNEANRVSCEKPKYNTYHLWEMCKQLEKDLDLLDLYKKFFKYSLTEIQMIKYLVLPNNSDIRRPDSLLKITDEEYELLKEALENDK